MLPLERTLIIAPHPDDEAIACGGLIQRVVAAGGAVRVLFVTDGENNPWPMRYRWRKWFLSDADRARWGALRRSEALRSLETLGVAAACNRFFAYPDHGVMAMARRGETALADDIAREVDDLQPTLIVAPSMFDLHADHRAIAWYVHQVACDAEVVTYVIHGGGHPARVRERLALSDGERQRKLEAVSCHESQLLLSRRRFLSYVTNEEVFYASEREVVRVESRFTTIRKRVAHALFVTCTGRR
jgi:LmbE family N-acetylglucosaminyl deacetylase